MCTNAFDILLTLLGYHTKSLYPLLRGKLFHVTFVSYDQRSSARTYLWICLQRRKERHLVSFCYVNQAVRKGKTTDVTL